MSQTSILEYVPPKWKERIVRDSQRFKNSEGAISLLVGGYAKVSEIHDKLIDLVNRETKLVYGDWDGDPYLKELYYINTSRNRVESELRDTTKRIFNSFSGFSEGVQLEALALLFHTMPCPRSTASVSELKNSLLGMLQFPRRFVKGVDLISSFTSKEYSKHGISWSFREFQNSLNYTIKTQINQTGTDDVNFLALQKLILPGSYGSSPRN